MTAPFPAVPNLPLHVDHGTRAGYHRHYRKRERPCGECRAAASAHRRQKLAEAPPCEVDGCERHRANGGRMCSMHQTRMRRYGHLDGIKPRRTPAENFAHFTPDRPVDGCWEWQGDRGSKGYGAMWVEARKLSAHRYSYEIHNGPIPDGLHVRHTCDNPPCVNPAHLLVGTAAENIGDMVARNRHKYGSGHPHAVLNEEAVIEIRRLVRQGVQKAELARTFGVDKGTIGAAVSGRTWRHVPFDEEVAS